MIAMDDRKQVRWVGVKRHWSAVTRATRVAVLLFSTTWRCRKLNHVVAAGPKIAVGSHQLDHSTENNQIGLKGTSTVEGHAPGSGHVMLFPSFAVDGLLREYIAAAEEDLLW